MSFEIRAIPFSGIVDYISGDRFRRAPLLPITPERALSQQKNPNANPDDTCLWVAEDHEGAVVGFAGSLPGYDVHNQAGMGWNSCWWVDPERGRDVAMPLFYSFLQQWEQRVAFADMTSHTHSIIHQLGFCNTREEELVLAYLRVPVLKIITKLGWKGKILSPLIRMVSFLVNESVQARLNRRAGYGDTDLAVSIAPIDRDIFDFIEQHRGRDFVQRTLEEYRWIGEHPWLLTESASPGEAAKRYPFSYLVKSYRQEWLVSRRGGVIISVMQVSVRDGVLKVLSYFGDSSADAAETLTRYVAGHKEVYALIFNHPYLLEYAAAFRRISLKTSRKLRWVGVSKEIMDHLPDDMVIQLGDGDSVFT